MRELRRAGLVFAAVTFSCAAFASAGQRIDINAVPAGARYCPAPWADNTEFMSSYFSVDARTGVMTRHDADSAPVGAAPVPQDREEVLFVSPPISVENVYVPPPGGSAVPPRIVATGVVGQRGGAQARPRAPGQGSAVRQAAPSGRQAVGSGWVASPHRQGPAR